MAEGKLTAKTVTDARARWQKGFSFEKLKGKEIGLRFEMRDAEFYSFSFHE